MTPPGALPAGLVGALAALVGDEHVLVDGDQRAGYERDWTGRFVGSTPAVVRPGRTEEVAAVLDLCRREGLAVVPQGGNTGLVGGSVPLAGEIVVSLRRLDHLGEIDVLAGQATVGAGATLATVQRHAASAGLGYGVDLAARDSATLGGTVATNAGGIHLLRWGGTRQQVIGVEAVLADGSVLSHLGGLVKDNTGYHLPSLLCGSEGTLAVVTAARIRLIPRFACRVVALVALESVGAAVELGAAASRVECVDAAELFLAEGLALVRQVQGLPAPFDDDHPVYMLLEASADDDPTSRLAALVDAAGGVADVAVAGEGPRRDALWSYREDHTVAINTLGPPHKLDVTLPASKVAGFVAEVPRVVADVAPAARTWLFGHVGDGNIHVNVTGLDDLAGGGDAVDAAVLGHVASLGGSISAEHGIGTAKRAYLHLNRTPAELDAFRALKRALDPDGVLNPNVLLPPPTA